MSQTVYWIHRKGPGRLGTLPRPHGGDWLADDMARIRAERLDVLVSLLTATEITELDPSAEPDTCRTQGIEFISFPIRDRSLPESAVRVKALVESLKERVDAGNSVAVHCRAGIGRASLVAACVLVEGFTAEEAFDKIATARGCVVPDTAEQRGWVYRFADRTVIDS